MKPHSTLLFSLALLIAACAGNPYKSTNKIYKKQAKAFLQPLMNVPSKASFGGPQADHEVGTVNFNLRKPNCVIIHHTAQSSDRQTLKTFTVPGSKVSAHYVVSRDGKVYHMLNDYLRAWHAGVARWGNDFDINSSSIGIELDNNGTEPFSEAQIQSLLNLLADLKKKYNIPTGNFIGHSDIAPKRKVDPSKFFPWQRLAGQGFGYWQDNFLQPVSPGFSATTCLKAIGYDTRDSVAAIRAFKLHFVQNNTDPFLSETDKSVILSIAKKYSN